MTEEDYEVSIPAIIVSDIKKAMSLVAMEFYGNPQEKLKLLAFTGTKGKQQQPISLIISYLKGIDRLCSRPWTQL